MQHRGYTYLIRLLSVLAIVAFMAIGAEVWAEPTQKAQLAELLSKAEELWQADKKDQALAMVNKAIALFPNDADSYYMRGNKQGALKRYDAAITDMRKATTLQPDFAAAWGQLSWYLILTGDFTAARVASVKAQALAPDSYPWSLNLGHTYLLQGDSKTAYQWYRQTIPLIPDDDAFEQGPIADFKLFIDKHWQAKESKQAMEWITKEYQQHQQTMFLAQIADKKRKLGGDTLQGVAKDW